MEISAEKVRELREKTGAGMMKCKEALISCKGNMEEAVDYLRKKGLASADGKAGRSTSQGLITTLASSDKRIAALVEVNCETDFVARNDLFKNFTQALANQLLTNSSIKTAADLDTSKLPNGPKVEEARKSLIAKTGENISISRCERLEISPSVQGIFDTYIHGDGNIGVVVQIECAAQAAANSEEVKIFVHDVALQVAAMKPRYISRVDVPSDIIAKEKDIILGQIKNDPKNANKPENILIKIVDGRLDKYYKEYCLLEQLFVKDDTKTISDLAADLTKKLGSTVAIKMIRRWVVGEKESETSTPNSECSSSTGA